MQYLILNLITLLSLYKLDEWNSIYDNHLELMIYKGFVIFGFAHIVTTILLIQFIYKKIKSFETK